jgi:hypothetical protein
MSDRKSTAISISKSMGYEDIKLNKYGMPDKQFRVAICAPPRNGKTEHAMNLIDELECTHLYMVVKTPEEKICRWMKKNLDENWYTITLETPKPEDCIEGSIVLLDDQILETKSTKGRPTNYETNIELFVWASKNDVGLFYLTQYYNKIPDKIKDTLTNIMARNIRGKDIKALQKIAMMEDKEWQKWVELSKKKGHWIQINLDEPAGSEERVHLLI